MATNNFRVAGFVTGLAIKAPVNTWADVNVPTLSGVGGLFNSIFVGNLDRILLTAQTNPIENGIYSVRTSAWIRDGDADGNRDFVGGTIVPVYTQTQTDIVLWRLEGQADAKTIGLDPLVFSVYYDPSAGVASDLQAVTDVGAVTDNEILLQRVAANVPAMTVNNSGRIVLENTVGDGDMNMGSPASDTFQISVNGVAGRFQFTGLTQSMRLLGGGGGTGPALVFEERAAAEPSILGFSQVWVRNTSDGEFIFTDEQGLDQNLSSSLYFNGAVKLSANILGAEVTNRFTINSPGSLMIAESASAGFDVAGQGQYWVRSSAPCRPTFTDDTGVDQLIDPSLSEIISVVASRTNILTDKGKTTSFSGGTAAQVMTIPASGAVAFQIGTFLAWDNSGSVSFDIAITTDTLVFADDNTTGTRTLAAGGYAVAQLVAAGVWKIAGKQLT